MADKTIVDGVTPDGIDRTVEIEDFDRDAHEIKASDLIRKIEELENENRELVSKNDEKKGTIQKLTDEIEALKTDRVELNREIERSESDKKALESIAARAVELETELSRLQHDFAEATHDSAEANFELEQLKKVLLEVKKNELEKEVKLETLEKEKLLLLEKMERETEENKQLRLESGNRIHDLKQRLSAIEGRSDNIISEKTKVEEEASARISEMDKENLRLKKEINRLESEFEKSNLEKKEEQKKRSDLQKAVKNSEEKVKELEVKLNQLQIEVEESERTIRGLKEKTRDCNGPTTKKRTIDPSEEQGLMGLKMQWPAAAAVVASTGTIAAAAVAVYFSYGRRR